MGDGSSSSHSDWRISLYYIYISLAEGNRLEEQLDLHRELCEERGLKGRIRISPEGINGVLSGRLELLKEYQEAVSRALEEISGRIIDLDVKYCMLREDIPMESQLFDSLIIRRTKTVISLVSPEAVGEGLIESNGIKLSRKAKAKRKKRAQARALEDVGSDDGCRRSDMTKIYRDMQRQDPSPHLTPEEWNARLLRDEDNNALLLDVRNVYESRVGHFLAPNVPTLLTNTRKYSDLPQLLANNPHIHEKQEIYMYCTGGVRCERVSMLVQSLYPDKQIYQLGGGIQTYISSQAKATDTEAESASGDGKKYTSNNLFLGKNFVFDPRRTDPTHGPQAVIGRCLVCSALHDDYDNGHAPSEDKAARCNECRMLILVCNDCRPKYVCWGEGPKDRISGSQLLYCGFERCIHEGAAPTPELIISPPCKP